MDSEAGVIATRCVLGSKFANELPDLTFGTELEYVYVKHMPHLDPARHGDLGTTSIETLGIAAVTDALKRDMQAYCQRCNQRVLFRLPWKDQRSDSGYLAWQCVGEGCEPTCDEFQTFADMDTFEEVGLEIKSRILSTKKGLRFLGCAQDQYHEIGYDQEIQAVLERLRERFCIFDPRLKRNDYLYPNVHCGLHVHVGDKSNGFPLETLKTLVCTILMTEKVIDEMHATNRINGTQCAILPVSRDFPQRTDTRIMNQLLSTSFLERAYRRKQIKHELAKPRRSEKGGHYPENMFEDHEELENWCSASDVGSWLSLVQMAPDMNGLYALWGDISRSSTVSIRNLVLWENGFKVKKRTIEFRQHTGTMHPKAVLSWMDFVVRLVWVCKEASMEEIASSLFPGGSMLKPELTAWQLCHVLGCRPATVVHYRNQLAGLFSKNLRHDEAVAINQCTDDRFAALAGLNIRQNRRDLTPANVKQRIDHKLITGGYGQFPRPFLDVLLGPDVEETTLKKITLGHKAEVAKDDSKPKPEPPPKQLSRDGSSSSERSVYSATERSLLARRSSGGPSKSRSSSRGKR